MKRLIYQVCLGEQINSKLYKTCIESVAQYCEKHGIEHRIERTAKMRIAPDPFSGQRSENSWKKHGGFLPIYEKENAFDFIDEFDQIAIVDADIYIREDAPNIFDDFGTEDAWGSVVEREMPLTPQYTKKIFGYSSMQYHGLQTQGIDFKPDKKGYEFFNMGLILINSSKFKPFLMGQTAKQFLNRSEFKDFIDGVGAWKWSTDQTLLNYFLKKYRVPTKHLDWKWNGLYTANTEIEKCHFVHFFLKDKLPNRGENVEELRKVVE